MAWTTPTTVWATAESPFNTDTGIVRLDVLDDDKAVTNTREVTIGDLIKSQGANAADRALFVPGGLLLGRRAATQQPVQPERFSSRVLSRYHLQILVDKVGRIWAVDLGSMHGSKVQTSNGEVVQLGRHLPRQLLDGEVLTLGKTVESKTDHRPLRIRIGLRYKTPVMKGSIGQRDFASKTDVPDIAEALGFNIPIEPHPADHIRGYGLSRSALYDSDYEEPLPRGREVQHLDEADDADDSDPEVVFLSRSSPPPVNFPRGTPAGAQFKAPMDVLKELLKETGHMDDPIVAASVPSSVHSSVERTPPPVEVKPEPAAIPSSIPNEEESDMDDSGHESDRSEQPRFMDKTVWDGSLSEGFVSPIYPSSPNYLDSDEEYDKEEGSHGDRSENDNSYDSERDTPFEEHDEYYYNNHFDNSGICSDESDEKSDDHIDDDSDDNAEEENEAEVSDHEVIDNSDKQSEVSASNESDNESTRAVVSETPDEIDWRSQHIFSFTEPSPSQPLAAVSQHTGAFSIVHSFNQMPPSPPLSQSAEEDCRLTVIANASAAVVTPPPVVNDNADGIGEVRTSRKRRLEEMDEPVLTMADAGTNPVPMRTAVDEPRPSKLRRCAEHAVVALGYMTVGGLLTIAGLCQMAD